MANIHLRKPAVSDGSDISRLVRRCPPLDVNSHYLYLLLCQHFAETCVVAESDSNLIGFLSGYRLPQQTDTLFVWQVAVDPDFRGQRLARRLVEHVLERQANGEVRFVEATISPSNRQSQSFFRSLAERLGARCESSPLFTEEMFPRDVLPQGDAHEAEDRYRIGPLSQSRT